MSFKPVHVPSHWGTATVEELTEFVTSGSRGWAKHYSEDGPLFLRVGNLNHDTVSLDLRDIAHVRPPQGSEGERTRVKPGDILLSITAEVGMVGLASKGVPEAYVNQHVALIRPHSTVWAPGLAYAFLDPQGLQALAKKSQYGATKPGLSLIQVRSFQVSIPPLPEQRRIVEAIESYFTRLDNTVATLERVQRNLKRYRASVLKAAVEGRLVPTEAELARAEGRDYEPASALLERILIERRRRWQEAGGRGKYQEPLVPDTTDLPELPRGWCWATMDHFVYAIEAGKNFRCIETPPGPSDVGVVKVSAVTWGTFDEDESKTCPRPELVNEAHLISPGDFLISRANTIELVGACVIVNAIQRRLMLSDKILRLRTVGDLDWWLLWVFRSALGRREIEALATGNQESMRNIGQEGIRCIRVPVPPEAECRRIITEIERQMSVFEHSRSVIQQSEQRCQRLRQAILKWAFEGNLADQDPSDEPASVLLQRIRSQTSASRQGASDADERPRRRCGSRRSVRAENKP